MALSSSPASLYKPLHETKPSIRLLYLHSGNFGSPIRCTLSRAILDHNPIYEALSYEWGPPATEPDVTRVVIKGQFKTVTPNLWTALRRLRYEDRERVLWIDALCIDQDNLAERSSQVGLMGRIYKSAASVVAWIGEVVVSMEDDADLGAISRRVISTTSNESPGSMWRQDRLKISTFLELLKILGAEFQSSGCKHIHDPSGYDRGNWWMEKIANHLSRRSYWERTWIIQEILLASKLILQYGEFKFNSCCVGSQIIEAVGSTPTTKILLRQQSLPAAEKDCKLSSLLGWSKKSLASNPKDKIYALLGLVDTDIHVDYTKSLQDIYHDVVETYLRAGDLEEAQACSSEFDYSRLDTVDVHNMRDVYSWRDGAERLIYRNDLNDESLQECFSVARESGYVQSAKRRSNSQYLLLRISGGIRLTFFHVDSVSDELPRHKHSDLSDYWLDCEGWRIETDTEGVPRFTDNILEKYCLDRTYIDKYYYERITAARGAFFREERQEG